MESQVKGKAIPVTDHGGPQGCETSRLPNLLANRFTHGRQVVSHMCPQPFPPRKFPGTHGLSEAESTPGP
jgi:hypothetical protein